MSKVIVLDYGHGGTDSGAVSGKHIEKIYNYDTGKACKKELERHNVTVYETRKSDEYLSISQRCAIAKKFKNVDYMVSIHHNAGGGDRGECIHSIFGTKGQELAEVISKEMKVIGQTTVKVYDREHNGNDYYGMIRGTTIPTVITEVAFLDNAKDVTICDTLAERQRNGKAIAHGILKKLGININSTSNNINTDTSSSSSNSTYTVKVTTDTLNVRIGPGTSYKVNTQVKKNEVYTIVETKNGWGKLKSGAGWICLDYTSKNSTSNAIKVGSKVKIVGSKYATGQTIPSWAKSKTYTVSKIDENKALIKEITSWVYIKDLKLT